MSASAWLACVAIGAAASLGGMIWAFRRGALGVLANFVAGIGGALIGAAIAAASSPHAMLPGPAVPGIPAPAGPAHLFAAGVGAIAALLLMHVGWRAMFVRRGHQAPAR